MRDPLTIQLELLISGIRAVRIFREIRRQEMALEIKGLKGKAIRARANIDALNAAYDRFNEAAPAHAADVEGLTSQVSAMQDDLQFAVTTLGNSTSASEGPVEQPVPLPPQTTPPRNELTDGSPAVEQPAPTFPAQ